jgi:hypothetical protein
MKLESTRPRARRQCDIELLERRMILSAKASDVIVPVSIGTSNPVCADNLEAVPTGQMPVFTSVSFTKSIYNGLDVSARAERPAMIAATDCLNRGLDLPGRPTYSAADDHESSTTCDGTNSVGCERLQPSGVDSSHCFTDSHSNSDAGNSEQGDPNGSSASGSEHAADSAMPLAGSAAPSSGKAIPTRVAETGKESISSPEAETGSYSSGNSMRQPGASPSEDLPKPLVSGAPRCPAITAAPIAARESARCPAAAGGSANASSKGTTASPAKLAFAVSSGSVDASSLAHRGGSRTRNIASLSDDEGGTRPSPSGDSNSAAALGLTLLTPNATPTQRKRRATKLASRAQQGGVRRITIVNHPSLNRQATVHAGAPVVRHQKPVIHDTVPTGPLTNCARKSAHQRT